MTFVKDAKGDFIPGAHLDGCRDHGNGVSRWKREIGLSSGHSTRKWEFIAKEQNGSADGILLRRNIRGERGFWLKWPKRILAEGGPGDQTPPGREQRMRNLVIRYMEGGRFWPNLLNSFRAKIGQWRDKHRSPRVEAELEILGEAELGSGQGEKLCQHQSRRGRTPATKVLVAVARATFGGWWLPKRGK